MWLARGAHRRVITRPAIAATVLAIGIRPHSPPVREAGKEGAPGA